MQADAILITAAGLGTRMGPIGKSLPKPMWPVFEQKLLDLQIQYVKRFGCEKIFVNSHHQSEMLIEWAKKNDVELLNEIELLGSGGCVHNLKRLHPNIGKLWIVNSDQFFFINNAHIDKAVRLINKEKVTCVLYALHVDKNQKYNEIVIDNNQLVEIRPNKHVRNYLTYSGVCLVNLKLLEYKKGASGFFDSVCDYRKKINYVETDTMGVEFWDFGTKENYVKSLFELLKNTNEMNKLISQKDSKALLINKNKEVLRFELYGTTISLRDRTIEINGVTDQI